MKLGELFGLIKVFTLLYLAVFLIMESIIILFYFSPHSNGDWTASLACSIIMIIPLAFLLYYTSKTAAKINKIKSIAEHIRLYRRIKMDDLMKRFNLDRLTLEDYLYEAVEEGYISGYVDRTTDEFFLSTEIGNTYIPLKCPNCGRISTRVVMNGDTRVCEYCGSPLTQAVPYPSQSSNLH